MTIKLKKNFSKRKTQRKNRSRKVRRQRGGAFTQEQLKIFRDMCQYVLELGTELVEPDNAPINPHNTRQNNYFKFSPVHQNELNNKLKLLEPKINILSQTNEDSVERNKDMFMRMIHNFIIEQHFEKYLPNSSTNSMVQKKNKRYFFNFLMTTAANRGIINDEIIRMYSLQDAEVD